VHLREQQCWAGMEGAEAALPGANELALEVLIINCKHTAPEEDMMRCFQARSTSVLTQASIQVRRS
jgi:hypothetical protein